MNPFNNLRPMPPSPCGCAPRPWPRPVVPVPVTPQMQPHWAEELRRILDGKQDVIADLDEIRAATVGAYKKPEDGIPKTDLAAGVQASLDNADTAVQPAAIAGFVDGAEYDADYGSPPKPTILMKHGSEVVATVDATDFVIDGMVSNVEVKNGYLVITFNTDSGKQPISIPLTDIFDPDNYYTKTAANNKFKTRQTPVQSPPTESTPTNAFIDTISQNANGVITPTKRGVATVAPASATDSGQVADALAVKNALAGKASTADATLTERFSAWTFTKSLTAADKAALYAENPLAAENDYALSIRYEDSDYYLYVGEFLTAQLGSSDGFLSCYLDHVASEAILDVWQQDIETVATRTALQGYQLGEQDDKPLASEAEAEALRNGKLDKSGGEMTGSLSAPQVNITREGYPTWSMELDSEVGRFHFRAPPLAGVLGSVDLTLPRRTDNLSGTVALAAPSVASAGNLAALDASGNPTDSGIKASDKLDSTSAAPAFTAKIYAVNNLCTYNGVIYRCKVGYTATASSTKPDADTTHWEVKPASDLFLPLTGGTVRGKIWVQGDLSWGGSAASISTISNSGISLRDGTQVLSYPSSSGTLALAASPATAGNLAALDSQGNPMDSGKKAGDFATAAQGTKADTAIQGVKVNGTALTPDANKAVNVQVPAAGSALPLIAGVSDAGSSANFSREDHVHPAETEVLPPGYALPASAFPVSAYGRSTSDPADIELFDATAGSGYVSQLNPAYGEVVAMKMSWQDEPASALAAFDKSSGAFIWGDGTLTFNGNSGVAGVSPVLTVRGSTVIVRGVEVASSAALALKQSKITASGILKGDGAGGVSTATAGTDYQAPLGFTPENASNKVTSLTAQSTDTQYPSAKCVYDALQGVDAKPTRIYNEAETDALDDKGQLFKSSMQGNYLTRDGTNTYTYVGSESGTYYGIAQTKYNYTGSWSYYSKSGILHQAGSSSSLDVSCAKDVNPTIPGSDIAPVGTRWTFTPLATTMETTPYAHFSLESLPDRTWSAGVWAVGDLVKYSGKAYRCKAATTASDTTAPSSDTTHWTEIPVLAQKADRASSPTAGHLASLTATGDLADSGKSAADFMAADAKINELYNANLNGIVDGDGQVFGSTTTGNTFNNGSTVYKFLDTETEYQVVGGVSTPFTKYRYKRDDADDIHYYRSYNGELVAPNGYAQAVFTPGKNPIAGDVLVRTASYGGNWSFVPAEVTMSTTPSDLFARVSDLAAFSTTKNYAVGDIAGYNGKVYKCTTAHTGAWNASHFTLATKAEAQAYLAGLADKASKSVQKPATALTPATKCKVTYDENGLVTAGANLEPEDVPALPYMPEGAHVRRVWSDDDSSTVDAGGVIRGTSLSVSKWTRVGGGSTQVMDFLALYNGNYYWGDWYGGMLYTPSDGKLYWRYGSSWIDKTEIKQDLAGKDPTLDSCTFDTFTANISGTTFKFTFTPAQLVETEGMIARFALESLPDATIAASTAYVVGSLLKDTTTGKAYRCISDYTSAATPVAPSSDTTHWTEIPVLAQKQDALSQSQLENIVAVPNKANDSAVVHLTGDEEIAGTKTFTSGVIVNNASGFSTVDPNPSTGSMVQFKPGGIEVYPPSSSSYVLRYPTAAGALALTAGTGHAGNLAALDSSGNPTNSQIPAANVAVKGEIPYTLGTPIAIDTASSEVVEGETVNYGAATLADRTSNIVQVTAATALDELRITFPAATSGKVRDFGLRVEIGTGSAALTAPALVPIAPTGETIKIENNAAEIPALADGTATAKGVTLLYFSENAPGIFVVKGEQVEEVA